MLLLPPFALHEHAPIFIHDLPVLNVWSFLSSLSADWLEVNVPIIKDEEAELQIFFTVVHSKEKQHLPISIKNNYRAIRK